MMTPLDVIAMHGWGRDARTWDDWKTATRPLEWQWQTGDRGYGDLPPRVPFWPDSPSGACRLVMGRSLGPHLVPAEVLRKADAVVLMASFAQFVPPGRPGRRVRAALAGMAGCLEDEAKTRAMLRTFLLKIASPQSVELLRAGPADGPLDENNRTRLREDLALLERCSGLPEGFPPDAKVLIVEAGQDQIVEPEARAMLRAALPGADVINLSDAGHALLAGNVIERVVDWVETWRREQEQIDHHSIAR